MSLKFDAISGLKWTSFSAVIVALLRLAQVTVLARLLSPVDFGLMAMALITIDIVMINMDLGVSAGIIHNQDATKDELSSLYWMNILTGLTIFFIFVFSRPIVSLIFQEPRLSDILLWISATFLIVPLGSQFRVLMQKSLEFNLLAKQEIITKICEAILAITLAIKGYGVWSLVAGYLFGVSVGTVILVSYGFRLYCPSFHFHFSDLKPYLSFGLYQMGTRTIGIFSDKLDQIIIAGILGTQSLGYYSFANNIANQPISRLAPVLTKVFFPVFSKIQHDTENLRRSYLKVVKMLMSLIAPLAVGMAVLAPNWVTPIFGQQWTDSILLVQILAVVALLKGPGKTFSSLALAKGKPKQLFIWIVAVTVYRFITLFFGGKLFGINGLAFSMLAVQLSLLFPSYFFFVRSSIRSCGKVYATAIIKPALLSAIMGIGVFILMKMDQASIFYLFRDISVGALLYSILLYLFDRKIIVDIRQALLSRK